MVKDRPSPGAGGMAAAAALAHRTLMLVVCLVTGVTAGGGALVNIIDMAIGAQRLYMRAGQFEQRRVVVKDRSGPGVGGMASAAALPHAALVLIIRLVAGVTVGGRALENIVNMAIGTQRRNMRARQLEQSGIVV